MKKNNLLLCLAVVVFRLSSVLTVFAQSSSDTPVYLDPKRTIDERVDDLMSRMTLKEKVGQLNLPCVYVDQLGKSIREKMNACKNFAAGTYTDEIGPGSGFLPSPTPSCMRESSSRSNILMSFRKSR